MELTTDKVIATYLKLRGQKEAIEAEAKEKVADIKANLLKLEAWLKEKMDADGETSKKTPFGTAFITTTDFAQVGDWDAVLGFIKNNEAWDMLEKRVSKTAVRGYIEANKAVPDGVNYGTRIDVNVRKPVNKADDK
tara:strand:- start:1044 stop:1451 length:408 start_codon:yes stop_codon:yes gene_type:complete